MTTSIRIAATLLAGLACVGARAGDLNTELPVNDPSRSVLYQKHDDAASPLTTETRGQGGELGDRCVELEREIEGLKGKPQRRFTAVQRFEAECRR